jgi:hypothetical protein
MEHYAGIDVSLEQSSVCVVDATGRVVREAKVASEPEALARWFAELALPLARIGLEAGPLSPSGAYRRPLLRRWIERAALDGSTRACGRRGSVRSRASKCSRCSRLWGQGRSSGFQDGEHGCSPAEEEHSAGTCWL